MGMYAGAHDSFFPVVGQGFAGITVERIGSGQVAAAERPYLDGSEVAQQMIIATRSDFHDSVRPGDTDIQQGTSIATIGGTSERRMLHSGNKTVSVAASRQAMALSDAFDEHVKDGFTEEQDMMFRRSTRGGGLVVTYPDIEWAPLLGEAPVPMQVEGRRMQQVLTATADGQLMDQSIEKAHGAAMAQAIIRSVKVLKDNHVGPAAIRSARSLMPTDTGVRVSSGVDLRWKQL